ncbi:hypothetical protein ACFQ4K_03735 [Tistrella bauzanensis]
MGLLSAGAVRLTATARLPGHAIGPFTLALIRWRVAFEGRIAIGQAADDDAAILVDLRG